MDAARANIPQMQTNITTPANKDEDGSQQDNDLAKLLLQKLGKSISLNKIQGADASLEDANYDDPIDVWKLQLLSAFGQDTEDGAAVNVDGGQLDVGMSNKSAFFGLLETLHQSQAIVDRILITSAVFGCCAIVLNLMVIFVLIKHRRQKLRHVFFILVLNFAIIDTIRGTCLLLRALRIIIPPSQNVDTNAMLTKLDGIALQFLRFTFLATILNLLLITLNEYIFIQFSLRYNKLMSRGRAILIIASCWLFSVCFVIGSALIRHVSTPSVSAAARHRMLAMSPKIHNSLEILNETSINPDNHDFMLGRDGPSNKLTASNSIFDTPDESMHILVENVTRSSSSYGNDLFRIQKIFALSLLGFCFISLLVILLCYWHFFMIVRRIHNQEESIRAEVLSRKVSEVSLSSFGVSGSGEAGNYLEDKRFKNQVVRRYKYAVVIGSVIAIYSGFLLTYAAVQMLSYSRLRLNRIDPSKVIIRAVLQLLFGIHALLQPLCYFRMRDFRQLFFKTFHYFCCLKRHFLASPDWQVYTESSNVYSNPPANMNTENHLSGSARPNTTDKPPWDTIQCNQNYGSHASFSGANDAPPSLHINGILMKNNGLTKPDRKNSKCSTGRLSVTFSIGGCPSPKLRPTAVTPELLGTSAANLPNANGGVDQVCIHQPAKAANCAKESVLVYDSVEETARTELPEIPYGTSKTCCIVGQSVTVL